MLLLSPQATFSGKWNYIRQSFVIVLHIDYKTGIKMFVWVFLVTCFIQMIRRDLLVVYGDYLFHSPIPCIYGVNRLLGQRLHFTDGTSTPWRVHVTICMFHMMWSTSCSMITDLRFLNYKQFSNSKHLLEIHESQTQTAPHATMGHPFPLLVHIWRLGGCLWTAVQYRQNHRKHRTNT